MVRSVISILLLLTATALFNRSIAPDVLCAEEGWRSDFDDVCAKTQDSMSLSKDQLKNLISRCDALRPQLEKLSEPQRKVMMKRLQMCQDLYVFVLQSKESH